MIKVAINGFGRIGRLVFRLLNNDENFEVIAINDLTDSQQLAYLLKYDSLHRNYKLDEIDYDENHLILKNKKIPVYREMDAKNLPWGDLDIDLVFECTGKYTNKEMAMSHVQAGAKKVIISAPAKGDLKTIVYGVNEQQLDGTETIISGASCTTNCLAPVVNIINNNFGIKVGYMTTVHAYTNDQTILDVSHKKGANSRRGRAAACNIIPTSTGAAVAIGKVIPSLEGKLFGGCLRVPVATGSVIDLTLKLETEVTREQLNEVLKANSNQTIGYTEDPIVSSDIIGSCYGGVVDGLLTDVVTEGDEQLVKIVAWYDNEMSYTAQMIRTAKYFCDLN